MFVLYEIERAHAWLKSLPPSAAPADRIHRHNSAERLLIYGSGAPRSKEEGGCQVSRAARSAAYPRIVRGPPSFLREGLDAERDRSGAGREPHRAAREEAACRRTARRLRPPRARSRVRVLVVALAGASILGLVALGVSIRSESAAEPIVTQAVAPPAAIAPASPAPLNRERTTHSSPRRAPHRERGAVRTASPGRPRDQPLPARASPRPKARRSISSRAPGGRSARSGRDAGALPATRPSSRTAAFMQGAQALAIERSSTSTGEAKPNSAGASFQQRYPASTHRDSPLPISSPRQPPPRLGNGRSAVVHSFAQAPTLGRQPCSPHDESRSSVSAPSHFLRSPCEDSVTARTQSPGEQATPAKLRQSAPHPSLRTAVTRGPAPRPLRRKPRVHRHDVLRHGYDTCTTTAAFKCGTDLSNDNNNCGACGVSCGGYDHHQHDRSLRRRGLPVRGASVDVRYQRTCDFRELQRSPRRRLRNQRHERPCQLWRVRSRVRAGEHCISGKCGCSNGKTDCNGSTARTSLRRLQLAHVRDHLHEHLARLQPDAGEYGATGAPTASAGRSSAGADSPTAATTRISAARPTVVKSTSRPTRTTAGNCGVKCAARSGGANTTAGHAVLRHLREVRPDHVQLGLRSTSE